MKKINSLKLCFTFAGCFLGAGYVSGQELWQFFASFGKPGYIGLFVAVFLQIVFGIVLISLARKTNVYEMDKIIVPWEKPWLRRIFAVLQEILLFGIFVIMSAGTGALLTEVFGLPLWTGSLILSACAAVFAIKGITAMVGVFSSFVPALVAVTLGISVYSLAQNGFPEITAAQSAENPLLSGWLLSAFTFVSYNIFGSIGILTPLGKDVKSKKTIVVGVALGGIMLIAIALGILLSVASVRGSEASELPMLYVAEKISPVLGYVYAFLLFGGMLGTSVSSVVALDSFAEMKNEKLRKKRVIIVLLMCLLGFLLSLAGFSELIGFIYPAFGYLGFAALLLILINYFKSNSCR